LVLACVLFMKKVGDLAEANTSVEALEDSPWNDESEVLQAYPGKVFIKHLYGPLFFGSTAGFQDLAAALDNDVRVLIIRMERVPYVDQSGLYALENIVLELRRKGALVLLTGVHEQPLDMLRGIKFVPDVIPEEHLFPDIRQCIAWLGRENRPAE
jgi:SulP family sulfate permease